MDKKKYKYVIVALVYRNTEDIVDFIKSLKRTINNYRVVIVNSFYDESTMVEFETIAQKYDCDFINIENKGYSFGNNEGVRYAKENYEFQYIICSNPDIVINKFDENVFDSQLGGIYGPEITTKDGRKQNPMLVKKNSFTYSLIYKGYKTNRKLWMMLGVGINKISRETHRIFYKINKKTIHKVNQLHGSFIVFSKQSIDKLNVPFDENLFLFGEEGVLAYKADQLGINMFYTTAIDVYHKEDGSMKLFSGSLDAETKKSVVYFYENYVKHR